jgi:hypothetical protein
METYDRSDADDIATALSNGCDPVVTQNENPTAPVFILKGLVSAEGIESANERKVNNVQGHGWQPRQLKAVIDQQMDRRMDRKVNLTSLLSASADSNISHHSRQDSPVPAIRRRIGPTARTCGTAGVAISLFCEDDAPHRMAAVPRAERVNLKTR